MLNVWIEQSSLDVYSDQVRWHPNRIGRFPQCGEIDIADIADGNEKWSGGLRIYHLDVYSRYDEVSWGTNTSIVSYHDVSLSFHQLQPIYDVTIYCPHDWLTQEPIIFSVSR